MLPYSSPIKGEGNRCENYMRCPHQNPTEIATALRASQSQSRQAFGVTQELTPLNLGLSFRLLAFAFCFILTRRQLTPRLFNYQDSHAGIICATSCTQEPLSSRLSYHCHCSYLGFQHGEVNSPLLLQTVLPESQMDKPMVWLVGCIPKRTPATATKQRFQCPCFTCGQSPF